MLRRSSALACSGVLSTLALPAAAEGDAAVLAGAYAAPVVVFGSAAAIAGESQSVAYSLAAVGVATLALPLITHTAYDHKDAVSRGFWAPLALMATTGFIGLTLGSVACESESEDDCFAAPVFGALGGAALGYVTWGVADVIWLAHQNAARDAGRTASASMTLYPLVAPLRSPASEREVAGLALGVSGRF